MQSLLRVVTTTLAIIYNHYTILYCTTPLCTLCRSIPHNYSTVRRAQFVQWSQCGNWPVNARYELVSQVLDISPHFSPFSPLHKKHFFRRLSTILEIKHIFKHFPGSQAISPFHFCSLPLTTAMIASASASVWSASASVLLQKDSCWKSNIF